MYLSKPMRTSRERATTTIRELVTFLSSNQLPGQGPFSEQPWAHPLVAEMESNITELSPTAPPARPPVHTSPVVPPLCLAPSPTIPVIPAAEATQRAGSPAASGFVRTRTPIPSARPWINPSTVPVCPTAPRPPFQRSYSAGGATSAPASVRPTYAPMHTHSHAHPLPHTQPHAYPPPAAMPDPTYTTTGSADHALRSMVSNVGTMLGSMWDIWDSCRMLVAHALAKVCFFALWAAIIYFVLIPSVMAVGGFVARGLNLQTATTAATAGAAAAAGAGVGVHGAVPLSTTPTAAAVHTGPLPPAQNATGDADAVMCPGCPPCPPAWSLGGPFGDGSSGSGGGATGQRPTPRWAAANAVWNVWWAAVLVVGVALWGGSLAVDVWERFPRVLVWTPRSSSTTELI